MGIRNYKTIVSNDFTLRLAISIILLTHSIPGILNGGIYDFGNLYLNQIGFAPFGVYIAWAVKLSHILCAISIALNIYMKWASIITILILFTGIILVHFKEGWYVVGDGRNGVEYSFLLICVLLSFLIKVIK
ncbi:DoxX family protein [Tenacibaculum crassostreae]|uniref:DoxX family protein n=1 Tax=Tenacibaculum crassostreae TaxID=502683 RepID=UPI003892F7C3